MKRSLTRAVGIAIGLLGLFYVVRLVVDQQQQAGQLIRDVDFGSLVTALVLGLIGMSIIGLAWNHLLALLDRRLDTAIALRAYFVGQLGKYVPGGVWAIVGRGEWARQEGVAAVAAYSATVLSIASAYVAASVLVLLLFPFVGAETLRHPFVLAVAALGVVGVAATHPSVIDLPLALARRLSGRELALTVPRFVDILAVLGMQVITWLAIGTGSHLVSSGLGFELSWPDIVLATAVSWVIGFLVLPVPGGIGIREGVFVAVLGAAADVATIALATRLVAIGVDVLGAGAATVAAGTRKRTLEGRR